MKAFLCLLNLIRMYLAVREEVPVVEQPEVSNDASADIGILSSLCVHSRLVTVLM